MSVITLPRDREVLRCLYLATSDQMKRWDEARALFRAAFRQLDDRMHDKLSSDEKWVMVKSIIPESAPLIHLSSEIELFLPNVARMRVSLVTLGTDDYWIEATYLESPRISEHAKTVDANLVGLIALVNDLRTQILEAMTDWSKFRPPGEWEWVFEYLGEQCSWKTITRKNLRKHPKSTTKLVGFEIGQLPTGYDDTLTPPKNRVK